MEKLTVHDSRLADIILVETERLQLAPLDTRDSVELRILTDDRAITEAIDFLPSPLTQSDADALIAHQQVDRDVFFGIRIRKDGSLVGVIGAHLLASEVEIGYWIGMDFQGHGFATEALRGLVARLRWTSSSRQIFAECKLENRASWRVLEKAGFVPAGSAGRRAGRQRLIFPEGRPDISKSNLGARPMRESNGRLI
jgi:RimJ/RimL family protein N-acetyltransferase